MRDLLRRFIAVVSLVVPGARRREFRDEWNAELTAAWTHRPRPSWQGRAWLAARALGSVPDAWCLFRQQWSVDMLMQDIRYALRLMRQRVAYTLIVIVTLALGIGANTAMFSAIHAVLLRPLPFKDPGRLVRIWENDRLNHKPRYPVAPANFEDWRTGTQTLQQVAACLQQGGSVSGHGGEPFHANVSAVTADFFDTLGVVPALGRPLTHADGVAPHHRVLILSHATWLSHFGGDRDVLEKSVQLGGAAYRIIAVMPASFAFPDRTVDIWRPFPFAGDLLSNRALHFLTVIARVKPTATIEQARADLETIANAAQKKYPATNEQRGTTMAPLQEAMVGEVRRPMYLLGAAVALLLLIACANVANLMLVQASTRVREMAVRSALGADRFRIARQLLVEGTLLALASGAAGVALAVWGSHALARVAVDYVPRASDVRIDGAVLAFAVVVSLATGLFFAFAPAVRASRSDVQRDLREGARGSVGAGRSVRSALVVAEFAAAVVLVIGAALLLKSFWRVLHVQPGFESAHVLAVETELPSPRYDDEPALRQFYDALIARVTALPGVHGAALVNNLPLSGAAWTAWLTIENRPRPSGEPPEVGYRITTPGYLSSLRIPLVGGRWLADSDTGTSPPVAVVNQALADEFFPAGDAIGAHVRLGPDPKAPWRTVVGVIGNVRHAGPESSPAPEAFVPLSQDAMGDLTLVVRADGDRTAIGSAVRAVARSLDPGVVLWRMQWMDGMLDEHLAPRRLALLLTEGFAGIALGLALLGIYGVMSYTVAQRVPEIGVRMALGAAPGEIHRMVIRDGLALAIPGLIVGAAVALAVTRVAQSMLFEVSPADPVAFVTVAIGVLAVATIACYLPARRAARVDPLSAIRVE